MSHEDYARWLLALNYFLGPRPKFIDKYPKYFAAFVLNLTHDQVTFTHEPVAKKVLNDTITNKLVKFKFARQELSSIKQEAIAITMRVGHPVQQPTDGKLSYSLRSRASPS